TNNTATAYADYADKPDFSTAVGLYTAPVNVDITTTEPGATIRYTIDGTLPTTSSAIYSAPINLTSTKVVKAITYSTDPTILPSFIEFGTYFINVSHTFPIVSIAATSLSNLANGSGTLEPKGSFELFDVNGNRVANTYGEFNRHGQDSWVLSQRSLDFASRDEMGYNHSVEHPIFASTTRSNFQKLILRAGGDDNYPADHRPANAGSAHIRDAYIQNMAIEGGLNLDVRRGTKCIVYLNGNYWGIYDIRDNPDDHDYTDFYYGQDKYNLYYIETWGNTWAEYGGANALNSWNSFYSYAMSANMNDPIAYQYVMDRYDATSLVDYVLVNSFTVCSDWLNYNTGWWRGLDSTGSHLKWGYILWDNDATFGHYINYTGIANTGPNANPCQVETLAGSSDPKGHIALLNKLRTNPAFNRYYINRQIDLWNTVFSCDNMLANLDSIINILSPEMTAHANRWNGTYTEWYNNAQDLRDFIVTRCNNLSTGLMNCYSLTGPYELTLNTDPVGAGTVQLNSLNISNFPWTGTYFGNIQTSISASANPGYGFTGWTPGSQVFNPGVTTPAVTFTLTSADSVTAHFTGSTFLPEVPETNPSITAMPSVFSDQTTIELYLPSKSSVAMSLYSVDGRKVMTLEEHAGLNSGLHKFELNLSSSSCSNGIYFLELVSGNFRQTIKLVYNP
ncbi:MAG: CotH kinase family protein, partial [Bacteroidia bacterium]